MTSGPLPSTTVRNLTPLVSIILKVRSTMAELLATRLVAQLIKIAKRNSAGLFTRHRSRVRLEFNRSEYAITKHGTVGAIGHKRHRKTMNFCNRLRWAR